MKYTCLDAKVNGHTATLSVGSSKLIPNSQAYIIECFTLTGSNICTTGDSKTDLDVFNTDALSQLKTQLGYKFKGIVDAATRQPVSNPVTTDANGQFSPINWTDSTTRAQGRRFMALQLVQNQTQQNTTGTGGQQQDTFALEGGLANCVTLRWDPYGVVFDGQSLEPVPGVSVTLLQKTGSRYETVKTDDMGVLENPSVTLEDGAFSYIVPDGTYKLGIVRSNYVFPNDPIKLHPNYTLAYSDIYRGEDIIQQGGIQHRDVPIDSLGTPFHGPVKLMAYGTIVDPSTNELAVQGRVSHPLTKINIYSKKPDPAAPGNFIRGNLLTSSQADKKGQFDIRINQNSVQTGEYVGEIELIKVDLTTLSPQATPSASVSLEPIPSYLEGYAYDNNGSPLVNSTVDVYTTFSKSPYSETTTDEKGFFRIGSTALPFLPYTIGYTSATGTTYSVTPSKFISQNTSYLTSKNINLYGFFDKQGQTMQRPSSSSGNKISPPVVSTSPSVKTGVAAYFASNPVLLVLIVLVILVIVFVGFYFIKKPQQNLPPPPPSVTTPTPTNPV